MPSTADTHTALAWIAEFLRAGDPIGTGGGGVRVHTTGVRVTAIVRAEIGIVALGRNTNATPVVTGIFNGAFIPILAGKFIGLKSAFAGG